MDSEKNHRFQGKMGGSKKKSAYLMFPFLKFRLKSKTGPINLFVLFIFLVIKQCSEADAS